MSTPRVSVLMPVYNGATFLSEAISDVLAQSFSNWELLVLDDGSTDDSVARASRFQDPRIRILRNGRNLGLVPTLNRGLAEAAGEWIARCDADDRWSPRKLSAQLALCDYDHRLALVGSDAILIDEKDSFRGRFRTSADHASICWDLCFRNAFIHSSVLFRRPAALDIFGGYRPIPAAEDYDLWSRFAEKFRVGNIRQPLVRYRLHQASIMAQENAAGRSASLGPLREIMRRNLQAFAGFSSALPDLLAELPSWLESGSSSARFWEAYGRVWQDYRDRHCEAARSVVGEHLLSMFYRQRRLSRAAALQFLATLRGDQLSALPWLKVMLQLAAP